MNSENHIVVYLCGSVQKSDKETNKIYWSENDILELKNHLKGNNLIVLNPNDQFITNDRKAKFGRDLFHVVSSHAIIVDGREKRGLGVGAEIVEAKHRNIPVIGYLPPNSYYRRLNVEVRGMHFNEWVHPFIQVLCDKICSSIEEVADTLCDYYTEKTQPLGCQIIDDAIEYYKNNFMDEDPSTKNALQYQNRGAT